MEDQITHCLPAEVLATTGGRINGEPVVIMTVRVDATDDNFESVNLALSPQQGRRLLDDLTTLFRQSNMLRDLADPDFESKRAYKRIMGDEPDSLEGSIHD